MARSRSRITSSFTHNEATGDRSGDGEDGGGPIAGNGGNWVGIASGSGGAGEQSNKIPGFPSSSANRVGLQLQVNVCTN